jgi:hypothetical protein
VKLAVYAAQILTVIHQSAIGVAFANYTICLTHLEKSGQFVRLFDVQLAISFTTCLKMQQFS